MVFLQQGTTPTLILFAGVSSPAGTAYAIVNSAGTPSAGAGSIGTTSVTVGGISYYFYVVTLTGGETSNVGDLAVVANDGAGGSVAQQSLQVVPWNPNNGNGLGLAYLDASVSSRGTSNYTGGAVASVTGDVGGSVLGNVVGTVGSVFGDVGGSVLGSVAGQVIGSVGSVAGNVFGSVIGSTGSVIGSVGSVAGNVFGSVIGSTGSVIGSVGSVAGSVDSVVGNVGGNLNGNVGGNVGGNVAGSVASVVAPTDVSGAGLAAIVAALLDAANTLDAGQTLRQSLRLILAALAGKVTISGVTVAIRNTADTKDRITAITDPGGQRLAITYDVS